MSRRRPIPPPKNQWHQSIWYICPSCWGNHYLGGLVSRRRPCSYGSSDCESWHRHLLRYTL